MPGARLAQYSEWVWSQQAALPDGEREAGQEGLTWGLRPSSTAGRGIRLDAHIGQYPSVRLSTCVLGGQCALWLCLNLIQFLIRSFSNLINTY